MVDSLQACAAAFFISTTLLLFSTVAESADDAYLFDRKVPKVIVHGASGANCTDSAWAQISAGTVDLVGSTLTLTGPPVVPLGTCTPTYYALSKDRPAVLLARQTSGGQFIAPPTPVSADNAWTRAIELPYIIVVKFHVLNVGPMTTSDESLRKEIATYMADAESIFSANGVGVLFGVNESLNKELDPVKVKAAVDMASDVNDGAAPGPLFALLTTLSSSSYAPGQLNVYLINDTQGTNAPTLGTASTFRAFFVHTSPPDGWDDFIVVNLANTTTSSFAHEIGHALSLDHVDFKDRQGNLRCVAYNPATAFDGKCDYTTNNLMYVDGLADRDYLTPPQVLRAVFNKNSFINRADRLGRQPPTTFECPDSKMSQTCPSLGALQ